MPVWSKAAKSVVTIAQPVQLTCILMMKIIFVFFLIELSALWNITFH